MPEQERLHAVHEVGVEVSQEECKTEEVSINLVYLNNKWLLITAQLEMHMLAITCTKCPIQNRHQ